jgi:hypothetical protein
MTPSSPEQSSAVATCVVCFSTSDCWRVLRVAADEADFPDGAVAEGGVGDHLDGHLPLCGECLLVCPTCEQPVVPDATDGALARYDAAALGLRWVVEPCVDASHVRPARPSEPPRRPASSGPGGPPKHEPIPNWLWVRDEFRGVRVGDEVPVPGLEGARGKVFEFWSHRHGGGAACTLVLADGSWVFRLAADVVRAAQAESARPAGRGGSGTFDSGFLH